MNKVEWKRLEGKNQKSKFQVTFQLQLENHHFESELKSDLKIHHFCNFPSIASIHTRNDVWSVEWMDWKGKIKSQNFKSLFSFNLKIIILSQN